MPILISYLEKRKDLFPLYGGQKNTGLLRAAANALGEIGDDRSSKALSKVIADMKYKPGDDATNEIYDRGEAAVALAKIGNRRYWKQLIRTVENPKFPYRHAVIRELNRHVDAELWTKVNTALIQGKDYGSIKLNTEKFTEETGVSISLEFDPSKHPTKTKSLDDSGYPYMRVPSGYSLAFGLRNVIQAIDYVATTQTFTYIFDDGVIRVLPISEAILWWETKLESKSYA